MHLKILKKSLIFTQKKQIHYFVLFRKFDFWTQFVMFWQCVQSVLMYFAISFFNYNLKGSIAYNRTVKKFAYISSKTLQSQCLKIAQKNLEIHPRRESRTLVTARQWLSNLGHFCVSWTLLLSRTFVKFKFSTFDKI